MLLSISKKLICRLTAVLLSACLCAAAQASLKVAIYQDQRSKAVDEIKQTLEGEGFEVGVLTRTFDNIYDYDVIFFGGGWSRYRWLSLERRMHLVEFVEQRGGGVIFSMFRCGTVARSMIRPIFPEVADGYNKVDSRGMIVVYPEHPVMEGLPEQFLNPFRDHAVMRLGPLGRALAVNTGGEVAIAAGQTGYGRVVFLGPWIGIDTTGRDVYPLLENDKKLLLNSVRWAGSSKDRDRRDSKELGEETKFKMLRRERIIDWTHNERGQSWPQGLITIARNSREQELDDLYFRLNRYIKMPKDADTANRMLEAQTFVVRLMDELRANYLQAVRQKRFEISRMSLEELEINPVSERDAVIEEWRNRLMFQHQISTVTEDVLAIEKELEPELEKHQEAVFAEAHAKDLANLRNLVEELRSDCPSVRANAALELGRIGEPGGGFGRPRVTRALVDALNDSEYNVRRNAVYALSWMQSKDAVAPLRKLLEESSDTRVRRRAAQALGQIGDSDAIQVLLDAVKNDPDAHVQQNALLALGWIGDSEAVEPLLEIASEAERQYNEDKGERRMLDSALRSLGYIGDKRALSFLEETEIPPMSWVVRTPDIDFAAEAVALIKEGGRGEKGVRQLDVLRDKSHFYWMTSRYNALFGRYMGWRFQPESADLMLRYAEAAGGGGVIEFATVDKWETRRTTADVDIDGHFEQATRLGLKINTQMPTYPTHPHKAAYERDIMRFGIHPSFGGLWLEENVSLDGWARSGDARERFHAFLRAKYTDEQLSELGIEDLDSVDLPQGEGKGASVWALYEKDGARAEKVVFAEYVEYAADMGVDNWQETQEFTAGLRKGTKSSFSMSSRYVHGGSTFISGYPRINLVLDAGGPQRYGEHSTVNNFDLDMHVDGESRPAQGEFYAHQADTPGRVERGFASSFVYGQQFFNWWWGHIFKHAPDATGGSGVFEPGRWEAAVRQFTKGRALSEYLAPRETRGAGLVAQLYSGRTTTLTYGDGMLDGYGGRGKTTLESPMGYPFRYTQNQVALREAILRSHLPVEMTWLETQHPEKLSQWKVAVLSDGTSLDSREVEMLRAWVANGGTLVATASSTLHDQWDRKQENYLLADVFGLDYVETKGEPSLVYVERDIKPETGISEIRVTAPEYLGLMEGAITAEYEKEIGYDVVNPTTARVVAVWDDETPAVLENKYGDGHVIFITAGYPALSHWTRDWTIDFLYCEFWLGMRELIAACVRRGLDLAGTSLQVTVENCPMTVDLVLKRQEQNNRWMAHLLNMDEKNGLIQNVKLTVKPPHPVKSVYYAYPVRQNIEYTETGNGLELIVRPFDVHEMVVIEW